MYSSCTNAEGEIIELKTIEERENKSDDCVVRPELFLSIKGPYGQTLYNGDIKGLTKANLNSENDSYDITEAQGLIPLIRNYKIQVTGETENPLIHEWEIRVTLKNLDSDQELNTGKRFSGKIIIQREARTIATECKGQNFSSCLADKYILDNNIIYHNGSVLNDRNIILDASDNSYRYSGGNVLLTEEEVGEIINDYFDTFEAECYNCYNMYWYKDDPNAAEIQEYAELQNKYYDLGEELSTDEEEKLYNFELRTDVTYF